MADFDTTHKRKYEDEPTPLSRRSTGFSAPIDPDAPPSYNNVPPPSQEFNLVKQKVEELASRALNADSKRSKFDNGSFDQKPVTSNNQVGNGVSIPAHSYSSSKIIEVPNARVGVIIGKAGETIKYLQNQSGARIQITRDTEHDSNMPKRTVELMGNQDQIAKAEQMIYEVLAEADSGASGSMLRRPSGAAGSESFAMTVPNSKVGLVIGKGGETIKNIQARSGARVQVIPLRLPPGDTSNERTVQIDGTSEQIEFAKQLVNEVIQNRQQNSTMAGGYSQQGYQAQPQGNWAPQPTQMQQPAGYGYMQQQSGAYTGVPSQYMSQPPYSGYPSQPTPGGYTQNWDQSNASNTQQVPPQGAGYDYYSQHAPPQQQPSSGPLTGSTGYSYNQPPSGGYGQQGYSQDGYGGGYNAPPTQPGYGQPQANPQSGYDHQQSYGSSAGYGGVNNPPPDGHQPSYGTQGETGQGTPAQQGYTGQSSLNPAYPTQGSNQAGYRTPAPVQGGYGPGYGPPQGQVTPNPPAYGQPEQSPSQGGGYTQPSQPPAQSGYPPVPSGYGQPDNGASQAVTSSNGGSTTQSSAYPPPYGAPPVAPPSYGQQPPPYYSGAYPQQHAYATDGYATGATPAPSSQPAGQPSGAVKTSP